MKRENAYLKQKHTRFSLSKSIPTALLAEPLLLTTHHYSWSLSMNLTNLMPPVILPAVTKIWFAPINQAWSHVTTIARHPSPLRGTWWWPHHWYPWILRLVWWRFTEITKASQLQIYRAVCFAPLLSQITQTAHRADVWLGVLPQFCQFPRSCFNVPVHRPFLYFFSLCYK